MSTTHREELLWWFGKPDDPEVEARQQHILEVLGVSPQVQQQLIDRGFERGFVIRPLLLMSSGSEFERGRLAEARTALRRVLARRQLAVSPEDEARIDACSDLATLERWLDQAITAASASAALE